MTKFENSGLISVCLQLWRQAVFLYFFVVVLFRLLFAFSQQESLHYAKNNIKSLPKLILERILVISPWRIEILIEGPKNLPDGRRLDTATCGIRAK